jgi:hypothetical protein
MTKVLEREIMPRVDVAAGMEFVSSDGGFSYLGAGMDEAARLRSINSHPSTVAIQPDPLSLMMYPALSSSSIMGCRQGAISRLGRIASDLRTANFSYII